MRVAWGAVIARASIALAGLWYFVSVPDGQFFSSRIIQFFGVDETQPLFRYFSIIDFGVALGIGLLVSHSIFWPCIVRSKSNWPRWGDPVLRSLDYFWYAGAAAGLVFVAVQAQGQLFAELRSARERELENHRESFISSLKEVAGHCDSRIQPPATEASEDYETAFSVIRAICIELNEAGVDRRELWIVDQVVLNHCAQAGVDYWPSGWGQSHSEDLWDNRKLLDAYSSVIGVCYNHYHVERITERINEIAPFENATTFSNQNPLLSGYISWFALLLAFRLSKTTAEVAEAVRGSRAS